MTRPFRDPVIYPGEPLPRPVWVRTLMRHICAVGGEVLEPRTFARRDEIGGWVCRKHGTSGSREAA